MIFRGVLQVQQPLMCFLQQRVLDPLGMKDTYFGLPPKLTDRLATVYSPTENGLSAAPVGTGMCSRRICKRATHQLFGGRLFKYRFRLF